MSGVEGSTERLLGGLDLRAVFDQQPTAYLMLSPDLVILHANAAYLRLVGHTRDALVGRPVFEVFPPAPDAADADDPLRRSVERALDTGLPDQMPLFSYAVRDAVTGELVHRVWSLISSPVLDAAGRTQVVLQRVEDVTDYAAERARLAGLPPGEGRLEIVEADVFARAQELRAALAAQEVATRRLAGMAQVALQLAAAETVADLIETVTGAGLAALGADDGALAVRDDDRGLIRVTLAAGLGESVQKRVDVLRWDSRLPGAWAATTGELLLLGTRESGLAWAPEMAEVYGSGRLAWAGVPLRVGDRLLGALVVGWVEERDFPPQDVAMLEGFAAQCALTLHRLQALTAERRAAEISRQLSEALQRSLLTEPPPLEHLEIAVRYRPASAGAEVGGDWYDAFELAQGDLTVVIGDVTGHDRRAAAVMAQVRNVLRGVAQSVVAPPGRVLSVLDGTLRDLRVQSLATAVLAQIGQDPGQAAAGTCTFRWSNAGHPAPLLVHAEGTATFLEHKPDLLLGLCPEAVRADHELELRSGQTLLLYTDGLIERRGEDLDTGMERLRHTAAGLAGTSVDELCDAVLEQLGANLDDDVALLALRVRPA